MTKIIIVDYSLKIVIAIINYDYQNLHDVYTIVWSNCIPYFYMNINSWKTFIAFL